MKDYINYTNELIDKLYEYENTDTEINDIGFEIIYCLLLIGFVVCLIF